MYRSTAGKHPPTNKVQFHTHLADNSKQNGPAEYSADTNRFFPKAAEMFKK